MSVSVDYKARIAVTETLDSTTTPSSTGTGNRVTHTAFDEEVTLNATSTPPATKWAGFIVTLTAGAATIDLTALTGTNGVTVNGTGLKPQAVRIKNLGANVMTFKKGAANGHNLFTATDGTVIQPGGHDQTFTNDSATIDDIDATHKTWGVTGTGTQTAEVSILLG